MALHRDFVTCEVGGAPADLVTVDTLARLALAARRLGCRVRFNGASPELRALLELCGLDELLLEGGGQTEEGEQAVRVEERVDRRDPPTRDA
jgi:hypothetical protein